MTAPVAPPATTPTGPPSQAYITPEPAPVAAPIAAPFNAFPSLLSLPPPLIYDQINILLLVGELTAFQNLFFSLYQEY